MLDCPFNLIRYQEYHPLLLLSRSGTISTTKNTMHPLLLPGIGTGTLTISTTKNTMHPLLLHGIGTGTLTILAPHCSQAGGGKVPKLMCNAIIPLHYLLVLTRIIPIPCSWVSYLSVVSIIIIQTML